MSRPQAKFNILSDSCASLAHLSKDLCRAVATANEATLISALALIELDAVEMSNYAKLLRKEIIDGHV